MDVKSIERECLEMKLKALEMALGSTFGAHIGGGFSAIEIMACLYEAANIPSMEDENRDRIIVSKGHAVLALYTALWKKGFLTEEDLNSFETDGSHFYGHSRRNIEKGIEFSGGSLGLGVSYATGVAKACKKKGLDNRVFVLLGDGEMNEGIVWEALMFAKHYSLSNLTVIVDHNHLQADGFVEEVLDTSNLADKFRAFGFNTIALDGHSIDALSEAYSKPSEILLQISL